jgi:hypothetical protein
MSAPIDAASIDGLSDGQLQMLLAAAIRSYAARADASDEPLAALAPDSGITATEAMFAVSAILKAVNVQVFELGMWQSWSGR